jgi:hypothetical protein
MKRCFLLIAATVFLGGCGSSTGLHLEHGGQTVVTTTPSPPPPTTGHTWLPRRLTARVQLGGQPAIVWDGGETMWAAVWAGGPHLLGSLIPVNTSTGRPGAAFALPASATPYLAAADTHSVWVAAGNAVLRIDPSTGAVTQTQRLSGTVRSVLLAQGWIWATVDHGPVVQLDPVTLHTRATLHVTPSPDAITTVGRSLLVTDDQQRTLVRVPIRTGRVARTTSIGTSGGGAPAQITVYAGSIWIYEGARVLQVAPAGLRPLNNVTLPGAGGSLAAGTGGVWVSGSFGIARIDPAAVTLDTPVKIGAAGAAIATTGNAVWVVQRRGGTLLRLVR